MTVAIIAAGRFIGVGGVMLARITEMQPMLGRPLIQRRIESLADCGERDLLVFVGRQQEAVRTLLGNGERWGATIRYRVLDPGNDPIPTAVATAAHEGIEKVMDPLVPGGASLQSMEAYEAGFRGAADLVVYRDSVFAALSGKIPAFVPPGREVSPGIWVSYESRIHRTARLHPPVYVGTQADVERDAELGPYAVIEQGALIGRGARIRNSLVLPMTLLGEGLEVDDAVIDGGMILKPDQDAAYVSKDRGLAFSLARLTGRRKRWCG